MVRSRSSALVIAALLAAHAVGCGSGGGGGGGSAGTSAATGGTGSSSGSSTTGGSGGTTTSGDTTAPAFTLVFPGRAQFVSGAAQQTANGTATDTGSGVDKVEIDGVAATLAGNAWSCPMTFNFGTNICSIKVTDKAGNVAESNWAFMYSPQYLLATDPVQNSAGLGMSANAVNTLSQQVLNTVLQNGAITQAIQALAGQSFAGFAISSLQLGNPTVTITLAQGGFATVIDVPITSLSATTPIGSLSFSADMRIAGTLNVAVVNGQFDTSMPTPPSVTFTNVNPSSVNTLLSLVTPFLGPIFQTSLPPVLDTALNSALAFLPYTMTFGQATVTVDAAPRAVLIDSQYARAYGDANFQLALSGSTPMTAPGSVSKNGGTSGPPTLNTRDLSITLREDLVNRLIYAAWVSGGAYYRFDESMITQLIAQLPLPFPLPAFSIAQLIIPYFPQLAAIAPAGGNAQFAFEIGLKMPPVVAVTGVPSLLSTSVGEMQVGIQIGNATAGWVDVIKLAVSAEFGTDVSIQGTDLHIAPGQPTNVTVDLLQNPWGFTISQINTFITTGLNLMTTFIAPLIPSIPLAPFIQQLPTPFAGLNNLDIRQDGLGADFLTIEGDL